MMRKNNAYKLKHMLCGISVHSWSSNTEDANTIHREMNILSAVYHFCICPIKTPVIAGYTIMWMCQAKEFFEAVKAK